MTPALLGRHLADPQRAVPDQALECSQLHASALSRAICLNEHYSRLAQPRAVAGESAAGERSRGWRPAVRWSFPRARKRATADASLDSSHRGARSWWPQVAIQLGDDPVARVRRLTALGGPDAVAVLEALADTGAPAIVIGELAGALHGWPLVLGGTVEVCARMHTMDATLERLAARESARDAYELPTGGQLIVTDVPPGTAGFGDLARGAEEVVIGAGSVQVAGLLDLLRIADASGDRDAARDRLRRAPMRGVLADRGALATKVLTGFLSASTSAPPPTANPCRRRAGGGW